MDYKGYLKSGLTKLTLWPGDKANPIGTIDDCEFFLTKGTCTSLPTYEEASIYLRLDAFAHPVVCPALSDSEHAECSETDLSDDDWGRLEVLIKADPLTKLSEDDMVFLWTHRMHLVDRPEALPKFLQSVRWHVLDDVLESKRLLSRWTPLDPYAALELLDANFGDPDVRAYAVGRIDTLSDSHILNVLLQLVQVLKYEPYLDSALARFLLRRALNNRLIGHHFFWFLRVRVLIVFRLTKIV
jgi:phosphatidylinositol-4,5-bisphosphate 3-kinase